MHALQIVLDVCESYVSTQGTGEAVGRLCADFQYSSDLKVSLEHKLQYFFQSSLWLQISSFKGITAYSIPPYLPFDIY